MGVGRRPGSSLSSAVYFLCHLCSMDLIFLFCKIRIKSTIQAWQVDVTSFHNSHLLLLFQAFSHCSFSPATKDTILKISEVHEPLKILFLPSRMSFHPKLWFVFHIYLIWKMVLALTLWDRVAPSTFAPIVICA